jgi:signal transduction histidine kinase/CheY-like chemotaxis protein
MVTALEERVEERTAELSESNLALRREIAERARIAEALRSSEEQQRALVTAIPDLILQIGEDGTIRSAKPGNALLEHWALDVCQGKRIGQLLPPDIGQSYLDYVHRALQTGEVQVFDHELDIGGEVLSCEARLVVSGQDQVVAIIRDITRERRLEKQFLLSQKMESAGRLAGGIAHEFNNLLAAIIGFSSLALESSDPNGKARSYLQQSLKASERGADLVQRFLTFARSKGSKLSIFDLNELIIETDKLLRHLIGEDIELVIVPSLNPEPVEADRNQIQQVIVNLATNARDAMPEGGKLIIGTASVNLSQPQGVGQLEPAPGKFAVLTVTDTGTGMDDEVKAHLFEPFFTTKEVGKGTGLGLSICYGLVSQNSGYIEVESSPDQGTTFKIYLPKAEARLEVMASENGLESGSPLQGTETVLLAEDEPLVRSLVSNLLRDQGYIVLEATNGLEALSMAQEYAGGQIDLLLSDVVMPLMGGRELAERLLMIFPGIKVLFMSGYTQGSTFYIDALGPQVELIQKPFPPNVLLLKVSEVMNEVKYPNAEPVNQTR